MAKSFHKGILFCTKRDSKSRWATSQCQILFNDVAKTIGNQLVEFVYWKKGQASPVINKIDFRKITSIKSLIKDENQLIKENLENCPTNWCFKITVRKNDNINTREIYFSANNEEDFTKWVNKIRECLFFVGNVEFTEGEEDEENEQFKVKNQMSLVLQNIENYKPRKKNSKKEQKVENEKITYTEINKINKIEKITEERTTTTNQTINLGASFQLAKYDRFCTKMVENEYEISRKEREIDQLEINLLSLQKRQYELIENETTTSEQRDGLIEAIEKISVEYFGILNQIHSFEKLNMITQTSIEKNTMQIDEALEKKDLSNNNQLFNTIQLYYEEMKVLKKSLEILQSDLNHPRDFSISPLNELLIKLFQNNNNNNENININNNINNENNNLNVHKINDSDNNLNNDYYNERIPKFLEFKKQLTREKVANIKVLEVLRFYQKTIDKLESISKESINQTNKVKKELLDELYPVEILRNQIFHYNNLVKFEIENNNDERDDLNYENPFDNKENSIKFKLKTIHSSKRKKMIPFNGSSFDNLLIANSLVQLINSVDTSSSKDKNNVSGRSFEPLSIQSTTKLKFVFTFLNLKFLLTKKNSNRNTIFKYYIAMFICIFLLYLHSHFRLY